MMINQDSVPGRISVYTWAAVTSVGLGLAFLSFIPGMLVVDPFLPLGLKSMGPSAMPESLDPEALPTWLDLQTYRYFYRMQLGYHFVALAVFGSIVGWFQSRVLREYVPVSFWVAATATGFAAILLFEMVERHVVVGPHAGPFEPLMISIGGSSIAGVAQWWVLHRRGVPASRWLVFWIVGIVVGVGLAIPAAIGWETATQGLIDRTLTGVVAEAVSWGGSLLIFGLVAGAVAGGVSARALNSSLGAAPRRST